MEQNTWNSANNDRKCLEMAELKGGHLTMMCYNYSLSIVSNTAKKYTGENMILNLSAWNQY